MGRLLRARSYSAIVFVLSWRGVTVFHRQPPAPGRYIRQDVRPRDLAINLANSARHLSSFDQPHPDLLYVRGYSDANRIRLPVPVSAWVCPTPVAMERARRDSFWLL